MSAAFQFLTIAGVVLFVLAVAAVVKPYWFFKSRKHALALAAGGFAAWFVGGIAAVISAVPNQNPAELAKVADTSPNQGDAELFRELAAAPLPSACEGGGIATGETVAVKELTSLRLSPSAAADELVNENATRVLGERTPVTVSPSSTLKELCRQAEWSLVQIVELDHPPGWVPVSALRQIEKDATGSRVYVEADFFWDDDTTPFKSDLVQVVNRIVRENERCKSVDPGTLAKSGNRGTKSDPVFFVTCNGAEPFNVWFKPGDAKDPERRLAAVANISKSEALTACEAAAKAAANNPSTVEFSTFWDVAFVPYPNGNSRLLSKFKAKNSFGVQGEFDIECFFEGAALKEQNIQPTRS